MTSARRIVANQRNARASTGPQTLAGKARSARNARRHGLSIPIDTLPAFEAAIDQLARVIAGSRAGQSRFKAALLVAEAQIDLRRIRSARIHLLNERSSLRALEEIAPIMSTIMSGDLEKFELDGVDEVLGVLAAAASTSRADYPEGMLVDRAVEISRELRRLDRYERRALSRRKRAARRMDGCQNRPPPA